jgi:hypothetical protein
MNRKYTPFYAEEVFIANCYGAEDEIVRFNELMDNPSEKDNTVQLILLIETIKERHNLTMGWDCCWRCQHYQSCEINWRRGELGIPKHCCPNCRNYAECSRIAMAEKLALRAFAVATPRAESPPCRRAPGNGSGRKPGNGSGRAAGNGSGQETDEPEDPTVKLIQLRPASSNK